MPQPTEFGRRLKEVRELRGFTQSELAAGAKIKPVMVSHFETGARGHASADTLVKLANALQVSIDYLLGRSDELAPRGGRLEVAFRKLDRASDQTIDAVAEIAETLARREQEQRKG